ncbi:hypothetical protein DXN04_06130 [Chitinophaga silvisoli]|uniref:Uncharacterized protein n=2 Tax=Chitinophaga silvisoli TaxID=2291814 RepID=A0A3E1P490_9BACT|nr:hypothetical protein DXN04_06130 [Chitinophaga silvisoli]
MYPILFCLYLLMPKTTNIWVSHIAPELFINGADTTTLYYYPFDYLDKKEADRFQHALDLYGKTVKPDDLTAGSRYWEVIDGKLYLTGMKYIKNSDKVLQAAFPDYYKDGKVAAYWFSGLLAVNKGGDVMRDKIDRKEFTREELFRCKKGIVTRHELVNNYTPIVNGIERPCDFNVNVYDTLFASLGHLNWKELFPMNQKYVVKVTIDENGKASCKEINKRMSGTNPDEAMQLDADVMDKINNELGLLQFDIVRKHGVPETEEYEVLVDLLPGGQLMHQRPHEGGSRW